MVDAAAYAKTAPIPVEGIARPDAVFFVLSSIRPEWSSAIVISVHYSERLAEEAARAAKETNPFKHFAVAELCSEARVASPPIAIVRVNSRQV